MRDRLLQRTPHHGLLGPEDARGRGILDDHDAVLVDHQHPLHHAGEDRGEPIALRDELADPRLQLHRERFERAPEDPEVVLAPRLDGHVEVPLREARRGLGHRAERSRRDARGEHAEEQRHEDRHRGRDEEAAAHRSDGGIDVGERDGESDDDAVGSRYGHVVELLGSAEARGLPDALRARLGDLASDVHPRLGRRSADHRVVAIEQGDLGIHDVRDARRDLVGMALAALLRPLHGALGLLEQARIELAHQVLGEPAVEREDRDQADERDEAYVTREELRAERHAARLSQVELGSAPAMLLADVRAASGSRSR